MIDRCMMASTWRPFRGIAIPNPAQATDFPPKKTVQSLFSYSCPAFATSPFATINVSLDHCAFFLDSFNILTALLLRLVEELHEQTNPCNSGISSAPVWIEFIFIGALHRTALNSLFFSEYG
jgi:hypothetical protein